MSEPSRVPVPPRVALALALATYVALVIFGLGMVSLVTGEDIIAEPGIGQLAGILAFVFSAVAVALSLAAILRRPAYGGALLVALAAFLSYLVGCWLGAVIQGADPALAAAVAGRIATSWFGLVVAASAAVCAWSAVALVKTRAARPRWPWEEDEE